MARDAHPTLWILRRTLAVAGLLALALSANPAGAADPDEGEHDGLSEYEIACLSCHGLNGRGDGPVAAGLQPRPADLTQIAKNNAGVFPRIRVYEIIDGRAEVAAHGLREMPVWGNRYRVPADAVDEPKEIEARARALMEALVDYIETLQEK